MHSKHFGGNWNFIANQPNRTNLSSITLTPPEATYPSHWLNIDLHFLNLISYVFFKKWPHFGKGSSKHNVTHFWTFLTPHPSLIIELFYYLGLSNVVTKSFILSPTHDRDVIYGRPQKWISGLQKYIHGIVSCRPLGFSSSTPIPNSFCCCWLVLRDSFINKFVLREDVRRPQHNFYFNIKFLLDTKLKDKSEKKF